MPLYMFAYVAVLFYCSLSGAAKHRFTIESICVLAHFSDSSQQKILQFISLVYGSFSGGSLEQAKVHQADSKPYNKQRTKNYKSLRECSFLDSL